MPSIHIVVAPFKLTDAQTEEVKRSFLLTSHGRNVTFQDGREGRFTLICEEATLLEFAAHFRAFILSREVHAEIEAELEEVEVRDLKAAQIRTDNVQRNRSTPSTQQKAIPSMTTQELVSAQQKLIDFEAEPQYWTPPELNGSAYRPHPEALGRISQMTSCSVKYDEARSKYIIKGAYDADIQLAEERLDALCLTETASLPVVYETLCAEGEKEFTIMVKALSDIQDDRARTMFFIPSAHIRSPDSALVVILVDRSRNFISMKQSPRDLPDTFLWEDHIHKATQVRIADEAVPISQTHTIDNEPSICTTTQLQYAQNNRDQLYASSKHHKVLTHAMFDDSSECSNYPIKLWLEKTTTPSEGPSDVLHETPAPLPRSDVPMSKQPTKRGRKAKVAVVNVNSPPVASSSVTALPIAAAPDPLTDAISSGSSKYNMTPETRTTSLSREDSVKLRSVEGQTCQTKLPSTWDGDITGNTNSNLLIDISNSNKPNAGEKRQLHRTMDQKAPIISMPAITPDQKRIIELLTLCRSRPGPLKLRCEFGQILLNPRSGPTMFKSRPFKETQWSDVFSRNRTDRFESIFIERLTASGAEIETILNTKLRKGRTLFEMEPEERHVYYTLDCVTRKHEEIVIEIREDGSFYQRPQELLIGAVNQHWAKHCWDTRLSVVGSKIVNGNHATDVDAVARSFTVTPMPASDYVCISLDTPHPDFKVERVMLRRETVHSSPAHPDLLIYLTESQDTNCIRTEEALSHLGYIEASDKMSTMKRLWWTASIGSRTANSCLQANESLQLGDSTSWDPQEILRGSVVDDLLSLSEDVVTRIDHIGFKAMGQTTALIRIEAPARKTRRRPSDPLYW